MNIDDAFEKFKEVYGKDYASKIEEAYRKRVFASNIVSSDFIMNLLKIKPH